MGWLAFLHLLFKRRTWRLVAQVVVRFSTGYIGLSTLMWDGVHTITFVVAIFTAGHPNHRMSKTCVLGSKIGCLCQGRLMCKVAVMESKVLE